jgi:hypothetical protein
MKQKQITQGNSHCSRLDPSQPACLPLTTSATGNSKLEPVSFSLYTIKVILFLQTPHITIRNMKFITSSRNSRPLPLILTVKLLIFVHPIALPVRILGRCFALIRISMIRAQRKSHGLD